MKCEVRSAKCEVKAAAGHATRPSHFSLLTLVTAGVLLAPHASFACAACYGQSDSPMAQGMNWGILSLLAIVAMVLGGVGTFFVFLAKKSAALPPENPATPQSNPSEPDHKS